MPSLRDREHRFSGPGDDPSRYSDSGHETAQLRVAVRAWPYGRSTGTGAFTENVVGQAVLDDELRARAVSVAAAATCPDVPRARIGRCRSPLVLHSSDEEGEVGSVG